MIVLYINTYCLLTSSYVCAKSCLTLCNPKDCSPPGSSGHGDSPSKKTSVGCHTLLNPCLPNPGIEPTFSHIVGGFLLSELPGKPDNTGVGTLSLLQGNFSIQELKRGLLHCRQILYQMSYPGSPNIQLYCVLISAKESG